MKDEFLIMVLQALFTAFMIFLLFNIISNPDIKGMVKNACLAVQSTLVILNVSILILKIIRYQS